MPGHPVFDLRPNPAIAVGPAMAYRSSGMITCGGKSLNLPVTQSRSLWRLLDAPQIRCNSAELIQTMRNPGLEKAPHTLRIHIHRLRNKLAALGGAGILIFGGGSYRLDWPLIATPVAPPPTPAQ